VGKEDRGDVVESAGGASVCKGDGVAGEDGSHRCADDCAFCGGERKPADPGGQCDARTVEGAGQAVAAADDAGGDAEKSAQHGERCAREEVDRGDFGGVAKADARVREADRGSAVERSVVGEVGGSVAVDQRSGGEDGGASDGRAAGNRDAIEEGDLEVGGSGAAGGRQRETPRKTIGARRTAERASDSVSGCRSRTTTQSGVCGI